MYQWTNPQSGNVQLSGAPPAWYRGIEPAPRVLVFDNGRLIDDTAISVSEAQRQFLRDEALGAAAAELPPDPAQESRTALREALEQAHEAGVDIATVNAEFEAEQTAATAPASDADQVARLKALIEAFDQRRLDQARALLDGLPAEQGP
ncbi:MAG: hypothetical protein WD928_16175 [Gammaproteobacteria bacterium]